MIQRKRVRTSRSGSRGDIKGWRNALSGVPAFLIGNGPSLSDIDLSCLSNCFTIGINRAFYKIDPTILMWQDPELWYSAKHRINRLEAIKFCRDTADPKGRFYHFKLTRGSFRLPDSPRTLFGFGSTGPLAFQLAHIMGCAPIVLLGMDCRYFDGKTDFYGKNPSHKPHTLKMCRGGLEWIKQASAHCDVINCSHNDVFEDSVSLEDAMKSLQVLAPQGRDKLVMRLMSAVR
jgi:hypothetical protein